MSQIYIFVTINTPTIQTDAIQTDAIQNDAMQTKYFFQPSLYMVVFFHDSDDMQTGGMLFGKQRKQLIMKFAMPIAWVFQ